MTSETSTTVVTANPSLHSSAFLALPRELRDQIYNHIFAIPDHRSTRALRIERRHLTRFTPSPATILLILHHECVLLNRQISSEALEALFKNHNVFFSCGPFVLNRFLALIGEGNGGEGREWLSWLRRMELEWITFPNLRFYPPRRRQRPSELGLNTPLYDSFHSYGYEEEVSWDYEGSDYDDNFYDPHNASVWPEEEVEIKDEYIINASSTYAPETDPITSVSNRWRKEEAEENGRYTIDPSSTSAHGGKADEIDPHNVLFWSREEVESNDQYIIDPSSTAYGDEPKETDPGTFISTYYPFGFSTQYPSSDPSLSTWDDSVLSDSQTALNRLIASEVTPLFTFLASSALNITSITIPLHFISRPKYFSRAASRPDYILPLRARYWVKVVAHAVLLLLSSSPISAPKLREVRIKYIPYDIWASLEPTDDLSKMAKQGFWGDIGDGEGEAFQALHAELAERGVEMGPDELDVDVRFVQWTFENGGEKVGDELLVVMRRADVKESRQILQKEII
ncbi:hypothetical protein K432DRAFT_385565 [Lepidopterella palustris CBS 459.81]|uniref:F-box domain-containing protein n=1 Tax=Lepidopterella palustris CBS 459.81 TaxID=1314670 RepID=A0A8E2E2V4_9PEZI|nr:hypothetical protein K432DRAFT_385565 [Lepidopterella palustris CBS 459.81]